ncbi:SIR2 family protein [Albibacterium sp.]|uniref:SIR2 family protein n=1 Tax=Albibacterium sp. TaxID=2952885 RepID=UPI002C3FE95B|nr:SIR2 family protein [Albibacterium sp.]HUH19376.1 SIR2 family protein [Albibacterium sp.]
MEKENNINDNEIKKSEPSSVEESLALEAVKSVETIEIEKAPDENQESQFLYINGPHKNVVALNPKFEKGKLISLENLTPFDDKNEDGSLKTPTIEDANKIKRSLYKDFLQKPFKNILILSGAGSSVDVGLPLMSDLWKTVETEVGEDILLQVRMEVKYNGTNDTNLEVLISRIEGVIKFKEDCEVGDPVQKLSVILEDILKIIRRDTKVARPQGDFPHANILKKLLQRKQTNTRLKVFTLNYDLLFEHAANEINAVIIDGFSFSTPRTFSGRFFDYDIVQREGSKLKDEDNFISRVFHLYKLHGSQNWKRNEADKSIAIDENTEAPLMIYPRDAKYRDSYEQPFFEMMARFQRNLRQDNDTLLICIGYSFGDNHINAAIEEAINQNPGFRLAVFDPYFSFTQSTAFKNIITEAQQSDRIMIVSETFTDLAIHYPELKTYDNEFINRQVNLLNRDR